MRKIFFIVMAMVFCLGVTNLLRADVFTERKAGEKVNTNSPDGTQQVGGNSGQNEDGDGIHTTDTHEGGKPNPEKPNPERKAGENNVTLHDQNQISGNLNGDGKIGNSFDKHASKDASKNNSYIKFKSNKSKISSSAKHGITGAGAGKKNAGFFDVRKAGKTSGKAGLNNNTKGLSGNSALNGGGKAGLNFTHGNGLQKQGMGDGSALTGNQSAH